MSFEDQFAVLSSFLSTTYSEADLDEFTDREATEVALELWTRSRTKDLLDDYSGLSYQVEFPWKEIGRSANRYFENEKQAREWLTEMMSIVSDHYARMGGS